MMMVILCNLYSRDIREKNVIYNKRRKKILLWRKSFAVADEVPKQYDRSNIHIKCSVNVYYVLNVCCVYGVLLFVC